MIQPKAELFDGLLGDFALANTHPRLKAFLLQEKSEGNSSRGKAVPGG